MGWIWLVRWREFQHYPPDRHRPPAWIKDYTKQLVDERYLRLTDRQRALLRDLRDIFAMTHGQLTDDCRMIARRRCAHTRDADLQALVDAGFVEILSRADLERKLESFYSHARARVEVEEEVDVDPPLPPAERGAGNGKATTPRGSGTNPRAKAKEARRERTLRAFVARGLDEYPEQALVDELVERGLSETEAREMISAEQAARGAVA